MNIHGYKEKRKIIIGLLKIENEKKRSLEFKISLIDKKINRLERAKLDIGERLKTMRGKK